MVCDKMSPSEPEPASPFATVLSAPLEAHLQITNRCASGCRGCYTAATPAGLRDEWGLEDWKHALDELAARGVFHVALGGGESRPPDAPGVRDRNRYWPPSAERQNL